MVKAIPETIAIQTVPQWKIYYEKNKDEINEKQRKYWHENKERLMPIKAKYYQEHRKDILEQMKKRYANPEVKKQIKKYYKENHEKIMIKHGEWEARNVHRRWAYGVLGKHKERGFKINITINKLVDLALRAKHCSYCNIGLKYRNKVHGGRRDSASLDRIGNTKNINLNNIQIICMRCNATKHDRTHAEFMDYCTMISNKFNGGKE